MYKFERHQKIVLVMQIRIEGKLDTILWIHKDRIDNGIFSLNLPNANGLDIYCLCILYIVIVLIV